MDCAGGETVLSAILRAGLFLPYGCKTGGCGTCKMRLLDGTVDDRRGSLALTPDERAQGWFLPCVATAATDCVVDAGEFGLAESDFLGGDRPAVYSAELVRNERLTNDVHALELQLLEPRTMSFTAGQFVNVELPGSDEVRSYSIASPPSRDGRLGLYVRRYPQGRFSRLLEGELRSGARLRVFGPFGKLRVRLSHRPMLMVASGTGIAPLLSMLEDLAEKGNERPVRLFYGSRVAEDSFALEELSAIAGKMRGFELVTVVAEGPGHAGGEVGTLPDALVRRLGAARDHDAYICGPSSCIETTVPALLQLGVRHRNVYFDVFTPAAQKLATQTKE